MKSTCPGQDTRFWKMDDVFEVNCSHCGSPMEFFRDDGYRRCRKCGKKVSNPKISLGCAQWCEHARECLGYDPKEHAAEAENAEQTSLIDRLVGAMKGVFGDDERRICHALMVLEWAEKIMKEDGAEADPKVVLSAAVLHDIGIREAERKYGSSMPKYQEIEGPPIAKGILEELRLDGDTVDHVLKIIANHHSAKDIDTMEFRIIWDADMIVNIHDERGGFTREGEPLNYEKRFRTAAGRRLAERMFS